MNNSLLCKQFTAIVILMPLLDSYKCPIKGMGLGTLVFLIWVIYSIIVSRIIYVSNNKLNSLWLYVTLTTILNILILKNNSIYNAPQVATIIIRTCRFLLVLIIVFVLGFYRLFSIEEALMANRIVVFTNCFFIFYQQACFIIQHRIVRNPLEAFYLRENYIAAPMRVGSILRPSGFFLEPSHFAEYAIVFLILALFEEKTKFRVKDILITIIGIVATGSGIGIAFVVLLFTVYLVLNDRDGFFIKALVTILIVILGISVFDSSFIKTVIARISSYQYGGNAIEARIGDGYKIFNMLDPIYKVIGCGYANVPEGKFLNGLAYVLNTLGFCGILIFFRSIITFFFNSKKCGKVLVISYVALLLFAQVFSTDSILFYFLHIISTSSRDVTSCSVSPKNYSWHLKLFRS